MEQWTGSKLGKEYIKAVYRHPAYLTYMQSACVPAKLFQSCPTLCNLSIMRNARLDESQAVMKIARRNINNLRYADDTTLTAESEEELKNFLMKVNEESKKVGLKLNIQKTKIMASGPITSWEIDGETEETVSDFILGGSKVTVDGDCSHEIIDAYSLEEKL